MTDPEVAAVVCARGGYGAMRILDCAPVGVASRQRPKWLVGFSDVTALHVTANARGVCTLHGPNVTGLGRSITAGERLALVDALEGRPAAPWNGPRASSTAPALAPRAVRSSAATSRSSRRWPPAVASSIPRRRHPRLEDVTERPYRLDRMLTSLRLGGHFARALGHRLRGLHAVRPGPGRRHGARRPDRRTSGLGIPVVASAPFGHGAPNRAFVLGAIAELTGTTLALDALVTLAYDGSAERDQPLPLRNGGSVPPPTSVCSSSSSRSCGALGRVVVDVFGEVVGDDDLVVVARFVPFACVDSRTCSIAMPVPVGSSKSTRSPEPISSCVIGDSPVAPESSLVSGPPERSAGGSSRPTHREERSLGRAGIARRPEALADRLRHDLRALRRLVRRRVERDGRTAAAAGRRGVERRRNLVASERPAGSIERRLGGAPRGASCRSDPRARGCRAKRRSRPRERRPWASTSAGAAAAAPSGASPKARGAARGGGRRPPSVRYAWPSPARSAAERPAWRALDGAARLTALARRRRARSRPRSTGPGASFAARAAAATGCSLTSFGGA